ARDVPEAINARIRVAPVKETGALRARSGRALARAVPHREIVRGPDGHGDCWPTLDGHTRHMRLEIRRARPPSSGVDAHDGSPSCEPLRRDNVDAASSRVPDQP